MCMALVEKEMNSGSIIIATDSTNLVNRVDEMKDDRGNEASLSHFHPNIKLIRVVHIKRINNMGADRLAKEGSGKNQISTTWIL